LAREYSLSGGAPGGPLTPALSPSEGERENDGAAVERADALSTDALSILARVRETAEHA